MSPNRRSPNSRPRSALEELEDFDYSKPSGIESNPKDLLKRASSQLGRLRKKRNDKSNLFARNTAGSARARDPEKFSDPEIARMHAQNLDYLRQDGIRIV